MNSEFLNIASNIAANLSNAGPGVPKLAGAVAHDARQSEDIAIRSLVMSLLSVRQQNCRNGNSNTVLDSADYGGGRQAPQPGLKCIRGWRNGNAVVDLSCWKCGEDLAWVTFPLRRLETCRACQAELHVCRFCVFYDTSVAKSCREPVADEVKDKERANFCGYLKPDPNAYCPPDGAPSQSRDELAALFGDADSGDGDDADSAARKALDDLFGGS